MTVLIITGTGTGVGKTIVTAALASHARSAGIDVAVCKPVQTGAGDDGTGDDDLAEVGRLAQPAELVSVARYPEPLAPAAAAESAGRRLPTAGQILDAVRGADRPGRLTLVEGAGGLLVELAEGGLTLRDLADRLEAPVLVVCEAGLGTLNHTALTLEAIEREHLSCAGLVVGAWPQNPGAAETYNRGALQRLAPVRAVLPAGSGALEPADFAAMSRCAFDPDWVAGLI
ncbi:MAG: dethiobiotin synthase [Mycobacteriaceae bacterium]